MEKVARFIKRGISDTGAEWHLYKLDPPLKDRWAELCEKEEIPEYEYVVVSAVVVAWTGPETYIFGADEDGKVEDYGELEGSFRGDLDHEEALRRAGYKIL